ncbi:MAG: alpha/beta fold hydrolase [Pseudomonadota bacterium]
MERLPGGQFPYAALFWPALVAASASETASFMTAQFLEMMGDGGRTLQPPEGVTASEIALDLQAVRLRDFSVVECGVPTILCSPFALHGAVLADLARGHSLVAALRGAGIQRLFMAEWRSASPDMRFLGIDDYLAALNVLVDHLGGPVDLVGLCQGGWLSLTYAARFPAKVRKLVMVGTPVDIAARPSKLSALAEATPLAVFKNLVSLGDGRVIGRNLARVWRGGVVEADGIRESLQTSQPAGSPEFARLEATFRNWNAWTLDMPGTYYLEVIEKLYKRNELATGGFVALGQRIDLTRLRLPMYLLAGNADEVVTAEQLFAVARLVQTPKEYLREEVAPSNHLGLFMGKRTLEENWPRIAAWLNEPLPHPAADDHAAADDASGSAPPAA